MLRPTEEYENGQPVGVTAPFRVYSNVAQSIADHGLLLATGFKTISRPWPTAAPPTLSRMT